MGASPEPHEPKGTPRRRYERAPQSHARPVVLTPTQERFLAHLAHCPILSVKQLARLAGMSEKGARRQMRPLFDAGLVDLIPVGRAALAEDAVPNDAHLLFGSAPNIYHPTQAGREFASRMGGAASSGRKASAREYGPKNALFLRHELAVGDVYVWLVCLANAHNAAGTSLQTWRSGTAAAFGLARREPPKYVNPDAWFVYRMGTTASGPPPVLVCLVEMDRGTERLGVRWREKIAAYHALFSGDRLRAVTGYGNARVLVLTPDAARRDRLAEYIAQNTTAALRDRFWLADVSVLHDRDPQRTGWKQAGSAILRPLFPALPIAVAFAPK